MSQETVAVFGLGKLGATLVGVLASSGHTVRGYDVSNAAVDAVNNAEPLVFEPQLKELLSSYRHQIKAFIEPEEALTGTSVSYVIVPTPSGPAGNFVNRFVNDALERIGQHLKKAPREYRIIIASTVMPGSCENEFIPLLEKTSGLKVGKDIGLAYSPEFIALGSIVKDMYFPDLVLVGESDERTGEFVAAISQTVAKNKPEIRRMSLSSAEVTKLAINTFITTKISFANMLSEICDGIPGANIDDVTGAVGADSRIGHRYLRGALGYGGPCFPRDNKALTHAAESRGIRADLAKATDTVNDRQVERIVNLVKQHSARGETVAIIGLAYKPDTPVTEASQAIEIGKALADSGRRVLGFDELVANQFMGPTLDGIEICKNPTELGRSSVVIITTPTNELPDFIDTEKNQQIIVDMWGTITEKRSARILRPGALSS